MSGDSGGKGKPPPQPKTRGDWGPPPSVRPRTSAPEETGAPTYSSITSINTSVMTQRFRWVEKKETRWGCFNDPTQERSTMLNNFVLHLFQFQFLLKL